MFLRNTWYIAAFQNEIDRTLKAKRILGEKIVFFRRQDGSPVALEDACPHRKLPLSRGQLTGDLVECGYHGLTFDCTGTCVRCPTQDRIPPTAKVKSYPATDRWGFVWIWMGEPQAADETKLLHIRHYDDPQWGNTRADALTCDCNYLFLTDNLLDPSHVAWVHRASLAAEGTKDAPLKTEAFDGGLFVSRWIYNREAPAFYAPLLKFEGKCDRLQHYEARYPSIAINKSVFTPAGTGGPDKLYDKSAFISISYNFLTPIDENTTRYHWFQQRNTDGDNEELSVRIADGLRQVFTEDNEILEAVNSGMANMATPNINLGLDAGALQFRRTLEKMIASELEQQ